LKLRYPLKVGLSISSNRQANIFVFRPEQMLKKMAQNCVDERGLTLKTTR
jgi:hypothetical protein